uniref:Uncharacterized protein n=1 Tax=Siphoviridae sp. ctgN495 TaxID=2825608 RepID=A0A8S5UCV7_9CAUD|nr:MAG TPA: hypothetical protein [Siphoviridae sp. ctgN495]
MYVKLILFMNIHLASILTIMVNLHCFDTYLHSVKGMKTINMLLI